MTVAGNEAGQAAGPAVQARDALREVCVFLSVRSNGRVWGREGTGSTSISKGCAGGPAEAAFRLGEEAGNLLWLGVLVRGN